MSAFDVTLNVAGFTVGVPDEESLKAGAPPQLEINLAVAMALPFQTAADAPPMMAQIGTVTYTMPSDKAVEFFKQALEAAEKLPKPSRLAIATDLSQAERAAQEVNKFRAG